MYRKLLKWVWMMVALALLAASCARTIEADLGVNGLPEGTPITMRIDFGSCDLIDLDVSTKAEATPADEERIHDLYVLIFCDGEGDGHVNRGQKIYGRYFNYEHLASSLSALDNSPNEGWWVENRTLDQVTNPVSKTRGAVKISTRVCNNARLVVIANINNGVCKLGDKEDVVEYLNSIRTYDDLRKTQVKLTQDVVNRKDLFLMLGFPEDGNGNPKTVNTGEMVWGTTIPQTTYYENYRVYLRTVDAKVKFKIRVNDPNSPYTYISAAKAVHWEVCNTPNRCYLFSDYAPAGTPAGTYPAPEGTVYFDTEPAYFEGTVEEGGFTWYVFSFYMLESRFAPKAQAVNYYDRERQSKTITDQTGYEGNPSDQYGDHYVENGEWIYALPNAPYVKFDMILTLTPKGIEALGGSVNNALTSDTIYTIHLGDFTNEGVNDYNTLRSTCYTYEITIANAGTIYAEVKLDDERQPGQEGYLLLTDDEIVNADCHYEYHSITFTYDEEMSPEKFSWYVKTPFTSQVGGGPKKGTKTVGNIAYPVYDPHDADGTLLDYLWVKFSVNVPDENVGYGTERVAYPGDDKYDKEWGVGEHGPWDTSHPELMDISQLIQYIFQETDKEKTSPGSSDFKYDQTLNQKVIRATIFIDEYYYETDPRDESANPRPDPNLWRQFVNAHPREMHILSKTVQSRDRKSDIIESSHSVVQQSIQTIYNVYEPTLRSIWGCEHLDEIKYTTVDGQITSDPAGNWRYWPPDCPESERSGANTVIGKENGRLNSAYIWSVYDSQRDNGNFDDTKEWDTYLNYEVNNRVPELKTEYHGMAWSCLTRNRDNNGNGTIDPEEIRWYMAASQQLAGLWVGTESLSSSARLYQPVAGQWRSHIVSSTAKKTAWAEEGAGATDLYHDWDGPSSAYHTWSTEDEASVGESVRCIRNIGTYDDNGVVTDISYAPVTLLPDKYFTLKLSDGVNETDDLTYNDNDKYYVFHFDRLNTKSIREYSPGELPYHDQMSMNNRVYVKLMTQPLSTVVAPFNEINGEINNKVTQKGHNDYCPEGYRFPNQTECLLMELYLPDAYMKKSGFSGHHPTRTYYDRGYYGPLRSDTEPWSSESVKVGWIYSDKMHCSGYNETITRSRCVKDEDQTGVISGRIAVEGNVIYPGDVIPVDFKFSSTASTFTSATLTLWYTKNGFRTPYDLTPQLKTPSGLQYKGTQDITIPSLDDLGLDAANLPFDMSLEVEFTNLIGRAGSHELAVSMQNPLRVSLTPDAHFYPNDAQAGTIRYSFSSEARNVDLASVSMSLNYTDQNSVAHTIPIEGISPSGKRCSGEKVVSLGTLDEMGITNGLNLNYPMTIRASVTGTNGMTYTTDYPVSLVSHLSGSSIQFPTAYDETDGIPVNVVVESVNDHANVASATFYWKKSGDAGYTAGSALPGAGTSSMSLSTFVKDITGEAVTAGSKYYFYLVAESSDGTSIQSNVWSMDVLYYNKCWNLGPWSSSNTVSQINVKWPVQSISNLDFAAGDVFDAYIDVTNCDYIRKDGTAANDIGMDNLITIGTSSDLNWKNGDIYFYYPAHSPAEAPDEDRLQVSIKDNYGTVTRLRPYDLPGSLTVSLSKNLLLVNGAELDYSQVKSGNNSSGANSNTRSRETIAYITNQTTIKIGSVEGAHRSRATYNYVRVIRNEGSPSGN